MAGAAAELQSRGHRVVIAAPGGTRTDLRRSQRAIGNAGDDGAAIFGRGWDGLRLGGDGPPVLSVGAAFKLPAGSRPRPAPVPVDVSRSLEGLLTAVDFDIVHVHDPFAPSAASAALRHSRALNAGTFHLPTERTLSTQVARPLVEIFFGRLDARMAAAGSTAELLNRFFPGSYEVVGAAAEVPAEDGFARAAAADRLLRPGGTRGAADRPAGPAEAVPGPALGGGRLDRGQLDPDAAVEQQPA